MFFDNEEKLRLEMEVLKYMLGGYLKFLKNNILIKKDESDEESKDKNIIYNKDKNRVLGVFLFENKKQDYLSLFEFKPCEKFGIDIFQPYFLCFSKKDLFFIYTDQHKKIVDLVINKYLKDFILLFLNLYDYFLKTQPEELDFSKI